MPFSLFRRRLFGLPLPVLLAIVIILLAAAAFGGYRLYHYTEHNPKFCASCHIMDEAYSKWAASIHRNVNCHDCHQLPYMERAKLVFSFLVKRPTSVPPRHGKIIVPYTLCIRCHLDGPPAATHPIRGTIGHKKHFFDEGIECTKCHGTKLHEFLPEAGFCANCHKDIRVHATVMEGFDCLTCHDFLSMKVSTLIPERKVCLDCHQDMNVEAPFPTSPDASMQFSCNKCHDPHEKIRPTAEQCHSCHDQTNRFGLHEIRNHQECRGCHTPHAWRVADRQICLNCHKDRRRHKPGKRCDQCHEFRDLRLAEEKRMSAAMAEEAIR